MEDYAERYGTHVVKLVDRRCSQKEFEFDQILLMPTARGYRDLVEQAEIEISPRIMNYLSRRWSRGTIENLSSFAMAVAVYARSISEPPLWIDVGKALLRTAAFCNLRCIRRREAGGGCQLARDREQHHLPKCIKLPRDMEIMQQYLKRYIATGGAICARNAIGVQDAMRVVIHPASDFAPIASC